MKKLFYAAAIALTAISCNKDDAPSIPPATYVYVETNMPQDNQNAVLAYKDDGNGVLTPLAGSPFLTNGAGVSNLMQVLGPLDSDYELRKSGDGKYLLAVNSGSNTIAVMTINSDGSLTHVAGSPFPSNGETPVSIDVIGNFVFVVNKSQDPLHASTMLPNYSTFTIDGAGKLTPVAGGKFETTAGASPAHALVSYNGKFLFGADFLSFMAATPAGTLRSFTIGGTGVLTPVAGTPYVLPNASAMPDNGALGLWQHPSGSPLYVGFPLQAKVGVYAVDATTGALSLQTTVAAGKAACWLRTNKAGDHLYVLNSADNTVQFYNTSNPLLPVSAQILTLKNSGPEYAGPAGEPFKTSQDFSLTISPSEDIMYVVSQHTNMSFSIGNFNYLHTLKIGADGMLTEATEPLQIPVPNTVRPKGAVAVTK